MPKILLRCDKRGMTLCVFIQCYRIWHRIFLKNNGFSCSYVVNWKLHSYFAFFFSWDSSIMMFNLILYLYIIYIGIYIIYQPTKEMCLICFAKDSFFSSFSFSFFLILKELMFITIPQFFHRILPTSTLYC